MWTWGPRLATALKLHASLPVRFRDWPTSLLPGHHSVLLLSIKRHSTGYWSFINFLFFSLLSSYCIWMSAQLSQSDRTLKLVFLCIVCTHKTLKHSTANKMHQKSNIFIIKVIKYISHQTEYWRLKICLKKLKINV